jgi:DNA-damage-inducible protein J
MATAILQVRVNDELKKRVDMRLKRMGLNMSTAVNMLMHQIDIQGKIPFEIVDQPSSLQQSINESNAKRDEGRRFRA